MLQLDTGLGAHLTGLGDVPYTAREAEEIGPRNQARPFPARGACG